MITQAYGVPKATNGDAWAALQTFLALPQVDVIDEPPELGRSGRLRDHRRPSPDQDFRQFEPEGLTLQLLQADGHPEDHDAA